MDRFADAVGPAEYEAAYTPNSNPIRRLDPASEAFVRPEACST
jgi:hypothetical protein